MPRSPIAADFLYLPLITNPGPNSDFSSLIFLTQKQQDLEGPGLEHMYSFDLDLGFKELGIGKLSLNSSAPCEREWGSQYASSRRQQCTSCQDFSRALDPIKYPHLVGGLEHFFFHMG